MGVQLMGADEKIDVDVVDEKQRHRLLCTAICRKAASAASGDVSPWTT